MALGMVCVRFIYTVPVIANIVLGWLYTFWGFIMALSGLLILLVSWRGKIWRTCAEEREAKATGMELQH